MPTCTGDVGAAYSHNTKGDEKRLEGERRWEYIRQLNLSERAARRIETYLRDCMLKHVAQPEASECLLQRWSRVLSNPLSIEDSGLGSWKDGSDKTHHCVSVESWLRRHGRRNMCVEERVASALPVPSGSGVPVVKLPSGDHRHHDHRHRARRGRSSGGSHGISNPRPPRNARLDAMRAICCENAFRTLLGCCVIYTSDHSIDALGSAFKLNEANLTALLSHSDLARLTHFRTCGLPQSVGSCERATPAMICNAVALTDVIVCNAISTMFICVRIHTDMFDLRSLVSISTHDIRANAQLAKSSHNTGAQVLTIVFGCYCCARSSLGINAHSVRIDDGSLNFTREPLLIQCVNGHWLKLCSVRDCVTTC